VHAKARMAIERAQMRVCVLAIHSTAHDKECTCVGVRLSVRLMQCSPLQSSEYSSSSSSTPPSSSSLGGHAVQASSGTVLVLSRLPEPPSTLSWASSHSPSLSILEFQCYRQRAHSGSVHEGHQTLEVTHSVDRSHRLTARQPMSNRHHRRALASVVIGECHARHVHMR
jgi:hypothetical protein